MCIRDRCLQAGICGAFDRNLLIGEVVEITAEKNAQSGAEAVSYTHLRAHETVLDLVCRLLLEKKKKRIIRVGTYSMTIN